MYAGPIITVVPLRVELLNGLALLLYPSIVLQVVYALAVSIGQLRHVIRADTMQMLAEVARGGEQRIVALLLVQLLHAAFVHNGAVRRNGGHNIVAGKLIILGELYAAKHVRYAAYAQQGKLLYCCIGNMHNLFQVFVAFLAVEEPEQVLAVLVVYIYHHIGITHVMHPRHMLIANALYAVPAEAVFKQRGALQRLSHGKLGIRILLLEVIARAHRARGAGREARAREAAGGGLYAFVSLGYGMAGHLIVPQHVAHFLELVEYYNVLPGAPELPGLVEYFLNVGFAAGRGNNFAGDPRQPFEAFAAHFRGEYGY